MAGAVVLAYLVSWTAGLPEHFWAAMSALIVIRPNMASTVDAAFDRVRGTLLGALCGLLGVGLARFGVAALVSTLGIVAVLAYVSAAAPGLRSAPVTALIVLSSSALAGHTAFQVAFLRVIEIAVGVAVAMAISGVSSRYRAADRLNAGCARLLRGAATRVAQAGPPSNGAQAEGGGSEVRRALDRLARLAASADRASSILLKAVPARDAGQYRRLVGLTGRVVQDAALLHRIALVQGGVRNEEDWHEAAAAASTALLSVAIEMEGEGRADLGQLQQLAGNLVRDVPDKARRLKPGALLVAPLHLLLEDLQSLCGCIRRRAA